MKYKRRQILAVFQHYKLLNTCLKWFARTSVHSF